MRQYLDLHLAGKTLCSMAQKKPMGLIVGEEGFEPPTPWFVATCSNPLSYRPRLYWICY